MKKINLYETFAELSKWDKNHLEDFLNSPYFNKRKDMLVFFYFLKNASPEILNGTDYALAYNNVYPEKEYSEKEAYLLFSYFYKLLEKFMAYETTEKDQALLKFFTAKFYRNLKMDKSFSRKIEESRKILNKSKLRNSDYLRRQYDLEYEYYDYLGSSKRTIENNLGKVGHAFDIYATSEKIRLYCFQLSHQTVYDKTYEIGVSKDIIKDIEDHPEYLEHPPIAIYYNYYRALFHGNSKDDFIAFRQKIEALKSNFTKVEIRDIYLAAINVCIKRVNVEGLKYLEEIFELYKNGMEQEIFLENDQLSRYIFTNILSVTVKLKKLDWLEIFIKKYKLKLNPSTRENIVNYATGVLRYEQKNYKQAMRLLAAVDLDDHLLMLKTRYTQIRIYYELDELEVLSSLLESTRLYIKRNKKLGYHGDIYLEIIKFTKKLMTLPPYDDKKRKILGEKAEGLKLESFKIWFLEQLNRS